MNQPSLLEDAPLGSDAVVGLILMYHRINVTPNDPWALGVSPMHFEQHLQVLRRRYNPASLSQISHATPGARAIAITFDDGYIDNLRTAAPMLAQFEVPATVFVAAGYIGSKREYWWDELERIILIPHELPEFFEGALDDRIAPLPLGAARAYTHEERNCDKAWSAAKQGAPSPRMVFFRAMHSWLMPLLDVERWVALDEIGRWAGEGTFSRADLRCVSREELRELAGYRQIEIGAHTVTHPALPSLSTQTQMFEVTQSRSLLEELIEDEVSSFSYPYGLFSDESKEIVRAAGFARACSTTQSCLTHGGDPWILPRIKAGDWDGATFERFLSRHMDHDVKA